MISYQLQSVQGFTPKIGELVWMLEHVRAVTCEEVKGLTDDQLNRRLTNRGNTIGELLHHIAAIEKVHQVITFENRDLTDKEMDQWKQSLFLTFTHDSKPTAFSTNNLSILNTIRKKTLGELSQQTDEWLFEERTWPNGVKHNPYYLWFHVIEDETNHRGQIRMMLRQMKEEQNELF